MTTLFDKNLTTVMLNGDSTVANGYVTINNSDTKKLIFSVQLSNMKLQLWSGYDFGIHSGILRYNTGR